MSYLKPQTPLQHKDGDYFYPLTTIDQVIMEDGLTRLSGADLVSVSTDDAPEGEVAKINAELLDGRPSSDYVLKTDAMVVTKNYSVVGDVNEPTNPTKNMIWVQTENAIGKVHFSGVEPSSVNDNDIWIYTGNGSSVAFDAIKIGNDTMNTVYPISAKQYVSGAWVDKTAKIWQNGAWNDWFTGELFKNGNDFEPVSGGWYCTNDGTKLVVTLNKGLGGRRYHIWTNKKAINLSNYKTVSITVSGGAQDITTMCIGIFTSSGSGANITPVVSKEQETFANGTHTLDVSSLSSGNYYIGFGLNRYPDSATTSNNSLYISAVTLVSK